LSPRISLAESTSKEWLFTLSIKLLNCSRSLSRRSIKPRLAWMNDQDGCTSMVNSFKLRLFMISLDDREPIRAIRSQNLKMPSKN